MLLTFFKVILYAWVFCLHIFMCTMCMPGAHTLELGGLYYHLDRNGTLVLYKSNKCS